MFSIRPELISLLISYMTGRKMKVKWRGAVSSPKGLVGGSSQGTLLGGLQYLVGSSDVASDVPNEDKYRYFDDLQILEVVMLSGLLISYDFWSHVPSDIGVDQYFLPSEHIKTAQYLHNIQSWSEDNLVKINEKKSNFMIFTRSKVDFTTRLMLNNCNINRMHAIKLLGIWITEDMSWQLNTKEMCKKAYTRVSMLTKLKYVGIGRDDLLTIYKLFIRSCLEYCSVVFHSSLTQKQIKIIENVQKVSLRVILGSDYEDYQSSLIKCNVLSLFDRREKRISDFTKRALKHPKHKQLFPLSHAYTLNNHSLRKSEKYKVNFAYTRAYKRSFVPYAQEKLNKEYLDKL